MLYQLRTRIRAANGFRLLLAAAAGAWVSLFRRHGDSKYLDGMRRSELEELGLRRTEDGRHLPFGDRAPR